MTREEAIEVIEQDIPCEHDTDLIEALDMAISALSQEPCTDAVSRQAVREILSKYHLGESRIAEELNELPSVTQKSGKWINDKNDLPICSQCGYIPPYDHAIDDYEYSNYCPNCGAKMENDGE